MKINGKWAVLIISAAAVLCAAGCSGSSDKESAVISTEEIQMSEEPVKSSCDDMFGSVVSSKTGNSYRAAAVYSNGTAYVYTDMNEYDSSAEYKYQSSAGADVIVTPIGAEEAEQLSQYGISALRVEAGGDDLELPSVTENKNGVVSLRYYSDGTEISAQLQTEDISQVTSLSEIYSGYASVEYPVLLFNESGCICVAGSSGMLYSLAAEVQPGLKISYTPVMESPAVEEAEASTEQPESGDETNKMIPIAGAAAVILVLAAAVLYLFRRRQSRQLSDAAEPKQKSSTPDLAERTERRGISVGKVHNIGRRSSQQDSMGITELDNGFFAAVADGMGGLANGDKVSQKIIMTMLEVCEKINGMSSANMLFGITRTVNSTINSMFNTGSGVKCGSTLIAVYISGGYFHWVSIGDSRIYLYRGGSVIQLNREHSYEAELMLNAINGIIPFSEVNSHPKRHGLTSFVGMGELKYIDGSVRPIRLCRGDRVILMSDGVYNSLSEDEMNRILSRNSSAAEAAAAFENSILEKHKAKQDNFTAIIIDI